MKVRHLLVSLLVLFFVTSLAEAQPYKLSWGYDTSISDVAQFNVYLSTSPGIVPDGNPTALVPFPTLEWEIVTPDGYWYAVVTAESIAGVESGPSNEIEFPWPLSDPTPPTNLKIVR